MGSGKSSSGRVLAKLLGMPFVDLDELIVQKESRSVNDIFEKSGEPYFRNIESDMLLSISRGQNQVVATGGGIVLNPLNVNRMKETGFVVYLKTSFPVLWNRVRMNRNRPLLKTEDPEKTMNGLFQVRSPLYETCSEKFFVTDGKTPDEVAVEIHKVCFGKS